MIVPTSVSSRFKTRPVTPSPKSSISLYIASARPSTLATPSPISRTTPTFCLVTAVFTPAICCSISCNKLLIGLVQTRDSKALLQRRQPGLNAAVVNIAPYADPDATDQSRVLLETDAQPPPVCPGQ